MDALDWIADVTSHIPDKGQQLVRYFGFYSNKSRGLRHKAAIARTAAGLVGDDSIMPGEVHAGDKGAFGSVASPKERQMDAT